MVDRQLDTSQGVKNNDVKVNLWLKVIEPKFLLLQVFSKPETTTSKSNSHVMADEELVTPQGVMNKDIEVVVLFLVKLLE